MYEELYEAWKKELGSVDLAELPPDFYLRVASYLRKIREENRMLDKRASKAGLFKKESDNVKSMVRELIQARYRKLIRDLAKGEKVPSNALTTEEEKVCASVAFFAEKFRNMAEDVLRGLPPRTEVDVQHKRVVLRFLVGVPAIMGADMKAYGPFKLEDIATLPTENAKILVKQNLAERIESK